jgi:hypothetical protein
MNLRFSLRQLLFLVAFAAVACGALSQPSHFWHSVVVTGAALFLVAMLVSAVVGQAALRAFAVGWLVLAVGYLAIVLGPWTGLHLGPRLLTSKAIARLELAWHGNQPSPPLFGSPTQIWTDYDVNQINLNVGVPTQGYVNINDASLLSGGRLVVVGNSLRPVQEASAVSSNYTVFQATAHWLVAVFLGQIGGWFAAALARSGKPEAPDRDKLGAK